MSDERLLAAVVGAVPVAIILGVMGLLLYAPASSGTSLGLQGQGESLRTTTRIGLDPTSTLRGLALFFAAPFGLLGSGVMEAVGAASGVVGVASDMAPSGVFLEIVWVLSSSSAAAAYIHLLRMSRRDRKIVSQ